MGITTSKTDTIRMTAAVLSTNDIQGDAEELTRILLVDDDTNYLDLTNRWFKRRGQEGYATDCAHSIQQAVACLVSNVYDCVIVDFHLPDGYGTDIADRLRDADGEDGVSLEVPPIIVVSGDGGEHAATQAIRAGAVDFIAKRNVTGSALRRAVQNAVDKSRLTQSLAKRNTELESKRKEVTQFYHTLSHEVKTPLACAREFVALVRDGAAGAVSDEQNELLSLAIDSCDQIRSQFMDLLEITRFDTNKFKLNQDTELLTNILRRSTAGVAQTARDRDIDLSTVGEAGDLYVFCDAERIVQVISNLLSNAIKFTRPGGWVRLNVHVVDETVRLEVSDNGCGIRPADQAAVFDRLYQVVTEDEQLDHSGLGLGLNITRDILRHHDTQLSLSSQWGVGSNFSFCLPLKRNGSF